MIDSGSRVGNPLSQIIRVLLAEDHTIVRKGLHALLADETDIEVIAEAEDGREAVRLAEQLQPDLVLMDLSMPGLNGLEATRQIKHRAPEIKILVLTRHANEEYVFQILHAGASGYVVKKAAPVELVMAIRAVYQGDSFLSPAISGPVIEEYVQQTGTKERDTYNQLTTREREVLQLVAEGHSSREIAEQLYISEKTVRTHRTNLMNKLGLHSTAELTQYAIRKGIVSLDTMQDL